ncbi:MAG: glycosyltransferase family A protein [Gemmataceae bacterium]
MPSFTIIIVSHNKPSLLPEAVESVLAQTHPDWQALLIDSGTLHDRGFFDAFHWNSDARLRIIRSHETRALRRKKAMAPWCFNECFRRGWVAGDLVMYLCDDDILYPNAFATFAHAFTDHPAAMAMYAAQDIGWIGADGVGRIIGERRALAPGGKCCAGRIMDGQVDYLQLCHRRAALDAFSGDEYWPEERATGDHADGLFMEKLGRLYPILPLDVKVSQNRRTPWSVNLPAAPAENARETPVHETIMDTWTALRARLGSGESGDMLEGELNVFQAELRRLCEQDYAQRRRLVSRRYQLADRLHGLLAGAAALGERATSLFTRDRARRSQDRRAGGAAPASGESPRSV